MSEAEEKALAEVVEETEESEELASERLSRERSASEAQGRSKRCSPLTCKGCRFPWSRDCMPETEEEALAVVVEEIARCISRILSSRR